MFSNGEACLGLVIGTHTCIRYQYDYSHLERSLSTLTFPFRLFGYTFGAGRDRVATAADPCAV